MNDDKIVEAVALAKSFVARAKIVMKDRGHYYIGEHKFPHRPSPKETGALRRQSLELTRALAEMRKP